MLVSKDGIEREAPALSSVNGSAIKMFDFFFGPMAGPTTMNFINRLEDSHLLYYKAVVLSLHGKHFQA